MDSYIQKLSQAETMFRLGGRMKTVSDCVSLKQSSLDNVESQARAPLFPFADKKSSKATGWMNNRTGALLANIIYREFRLLYPNFDLDNCVIDVNQLITVCLQYNSRYGSVGGYIDINQINSVFHAFTTYDLSPYKCNECNVAYVRTNQPSSHKCPWCQNNSSVKTLRKRAGISTATTSIYKKFTQYEHHSTDSHKIA